MLPTFFDIPGIVKLIIKNAIRLETTYSQVTDKTEKDRLTSLKPAEAHAQFIIIIANVITQAQVSKGGSNKNSLLCKCSYTAFFTLFYFHFVRGSKATFTCNYHPLPFDSPLALTQGLTSGKFHTKAKVFKNSENSCHF